MKKMLNEEVMILNKNWFAITIRNVKKAIQLASRGRACFIDPQDYSVYTWEEWIKLPCEGEGISTTSGKMRIPSVVLLTVYGKMPTSAPRLTKKNIFIRDGNTCQYTGKKVSMKNADIDHVIPTSRNGKNNWNNMVVCSKEVNRKKADRTPEEAGLKLIKKPKRPSNQQITFGSKIAIKEEWKKFLS